MKRGKPDQTVSLEDVLQANGEEDLYDQIKQLFQHAEEDPPLIFGWENVEEFVGAIHVAQARPHGEVPDPPFDIPVDVSVREFKKIILDYVKVPGAPNAVGTTVLPCSLAQFGQSVCMLSPLDLHPWSVYIKHIGLANILPVAKVYVPRPRSSTLDTVYPPRPNSLWHA